jgi:hypothetical protein
VKGLIGGAAILVLLRAALVVAAPLTADLGVERAAGAEDCPDASALEAMIARILDAPVGARPIGAAGGEVRASVAFSRSAAGYQATLRLSGAKEGQRTLTDTGPRCAALGRAVSITMALVLDTGEELAPPPAPSVTVVAAIAPPPPPAPRTLTSGVLSLTGGPAFGVVGPPSVTGGVELDVGVGRRLHLQVSGQYVAPRSTAFDMGAVNVGLLTAGLGICGVLNDPEASVHVGVCAWGARGRLRGSGTGFPAANEAHALTYWGVGGGLQVHGPLTRRFILGAEADVLIPVRSYTFSVGNRGVAFQSDGVAGMLHLAVGFEIW